MVQRLIGSMTGIMAFQSLPMILNNKQESCTQHFRGLCWARLLSGLNKE
jgi:hypothetical protein